MSKRKKGAKSSLSGSTQLNGNHSSMQEQLTELFKKNFGEEENFILDEAGENIQGCRSGFQKRPTKNRDSDWYKDNTETEPSVASSTTRKFQQPHHRNVKENQMSTAESVIVSAEAEAIGKAAGSKNEAAEKGLFQGRQEGIEEGRRQALSEIAKNETKGFLGNLGKWAANVYHNNQGKFQMAFGAALALGTQAAIVAYKQSQGQRTLALPSDTTLVMGPDGVFSPQGQGTGDGRQQGATQANEPARGRGR